MSHGRNFTPKLIKDGWSGQTEDISWDFPTFKDGLKDDLDYAMMQQNFILKMIMSFDGSSLCQSKPKSLILDIIQGSIDLVITLMEKCNIFLPMFISPK